MREPAAKDVVKSYDRAGAGHEVDFHGYEVHDLPKRRDIIEVWTKRPKEPPSVYIQWAKKSGIKLAKAKFPDASNEELTNEIGELWMNIDPEEMAQCEEDHRQAMVSWKVSLKERKERLALYLSGEKHENSEDKICAKMNCGDSVFYSKITLKNEIEEAIKNQNLNRISSKDIRLVVQQKLESNFDGSKKVFDNLVMEVFRERSDFKQVKDTKHRLSSKEKQLLKKQGKEKNQREYETAAKAWMRGEHISVAECAKKFQVDRRILHAGIVQRGGKFPGSEKISSVLSSSEEKKIYDHVVYMSEIGYGCSWLSLRLLLQEALLSLKAANPSRATGFEEKGQMPDKSFARRFAKRHNLSLRKTSVISKARAVVSPKDIQYWFRDIGGFIESRPDGKEALLDPAQVFNQDETAVELGVSSRWVLAPRNTKQVYTQSSNFKEHVTVSYTANAKGEMVPPRVVHSGIRLISHNKPCIDSNPKDGISGVWKFSVSENGLVKPYQMLEIIEELKNFIEKKAFRSPVFVS